jgi:hypothetical protein
MVVKLFIAIIKLTDTMYRNKNLEKKSIANVILTKNQNLYNQKYF